MDVSALKAKMKSRQIPSYLIFSGPEWKVQELYIKQISKVTDKEIKRIDTILDIYSQLKNKSFLKKSYIYVVRDDKALIQDEKLQQGIKLILADNILIHILTNVDKRTKYYKQYKDIIIEFESLTDAILKKYIKKEIDLSDKNCEILIEICGHDYGRCLLEIDKVYQFSNYYMRMPTAPVDYNEVFDILLKDGTIYQPPYDAIFDLVAAILDRKVNKTFDLLQQSYEVGEATLVMLSVLYSSAKAVLQIQTYKGQNLSKATGLTGWQIKNAKGHVGKYTDEELIQILKLIQKVESGIKTGKMEEEFAMQYILGKVM